MDFVKEFDNAIKNGYIVPFFQHLTRTITGKVCAAETLARWIDPNEGLISPNDFIPLLEENKLIYKLDLAMIENVCKFYNENKTKNICFSINISRLDFESVDMFKLIDDIMNKYNVPRNVIHLEITESIMFDSRLDINQLFEKFHNSGYEIWIDDFGSGFSSLHVLRDYKFVGKTIYPFCTNEEGSLGLAEMELRSDAKGALIKGGFACKGSEAQTIDARLKAWLGK